MAFLRVVSFTCFAFGVAASLDASAQPAPTAPAPMPLAVRPVRRRELGWIESDCRGDVEFVAEFVGTQVRVGEPVTLRLEVINNCKVCRKAITKGSWIWVEDGQQKSPYFLRSSSEFTESLGCPGRRIFSVKLRARRASSSVSELPVRLNISLQNAWANDVAEGAAVVDFPFYASYSKFEVKGDHNLLLVGTPGVGKTTFVMSAISALSAVPQQLQNLGGATLDGHTTQMVTRYPFDDWTENSRLQINLWDTWGIRPQNFPVEFLEDLCEGRVPHGFEMKAYERGEEGFGRWAKLSSSRKMGSVLFFLRADQIKHPEGLRAMEVYLNHVKSLGQGAILVVTWLHTVPNPDGVLAELRRKLQIPVLPFTRGCHPDCSLQAPSEVPSVVSDKDPEVDKHALVILEKALGLSRAAERVREAASLSKEAQGTYRRFAQSLEDFWAELQSAAWASETAVLLTLCVLVAGRSRWSTLGSFDVDMSRVPLYRRREVVVSPLLRQLLIVLTLLLVVLLQSLPAAERWIAHSSTSCSKGGDTIPIAQASAEAAGITDTQCRAECQQHPECAAYALSSRRGGLFQQLSHCALFQHCDLQDSVGSTVFLKPASSLLANITALAYVAQVVLNVLGLGWNSAWCYRLTALLCLASVRLCWGSPPTSPSWPVLMLHAANVLVLLAMHSQLRERLASVMREECEKSERLKDLELMLFRDSRIHGKPLRGRQVWRAQVHLVFGLVVLGSITLFVSRCASALSGTEEGPRHNVLNAITRLFVGVNSNVFMKTSIEALGAFVLSSPLVFGLRQVHTGFVLLLDDSGAELERAAALIAHKVFRVERLLACLKGDLQTRSVVRRDELEDMAKTRLGLPSASPESSALVCAAATYFAHGPDDAAATTALENWASLRAASLLEAHVEARHITSEMLFAPADLSAELAAAEADASGRLAGAGRFLFGAFRAILAFPFSGLSVLRPWRRPRARPRAADHLGETVRRRPATAAEPRRGAQAGPQEADPCGASAQQQPPPPQQPPATAADPVAADRSSETLRLRPTADAARRGRKKKVGA